ncbi:sodium/glutamate symporter [Clostridium sporogenes]|uniref:Sodium/glutamate symporter n=1 Tax=Clostridium sporogenes TaxID=1509 RepID=A0A7U5D279_CLOSG|nr:sodium/glutamate symporter [Clostridium sporogenes]AVP61418.1 sodium/glutamate symporter [Clostridium botulinum]AKC61411.1 sodium/glutamate symport carrier protein GltS [Clostridium sporogenes]AKJ88746.1 sodium:glutamate symporter [Clostridium sporogenes]EHN15301.1 sodium/glutamate symporter [Clostridium sporogenes PA 3679]KCZ68714.1 sodium/glutamate symport carrier protein GltS [Clostridium sporogenes]
MTLELDMIQTTTLAILFYYIGVFIKSKVSILGKFCIPAPVVGGLIFAILNLIFTESGFISISLDTTLQKPFMLAFFTTIGLGASLKMIKQGGLHVIMFFIAALLLVISQDVLGVVMAKSIGEDPLLGLIVGSVTMTGGHGTGATFGALFESEYGLVGASTTAMAAATFGLVCGSLIGGPIAKNLISKNNLKNNSDEFFEANSHDCEEVSYKTLFNTFSLIFLSMGLGSILEMFFTNFGIVLPSYIDAMIVAAIILNIGEQTNKWKINSKCVDIIGNMSLNVFLSMALISLKLWELKSTAGPLLILLIGQAVLMFIFAYFITFRLMGKDYDAAVMSSGHCGFGMGATPNGIANMEAITSKYGASPKAFFILPVVGAFLIDFSNSLVITLFVNLFK